MGEGRRRGTCLEKGPEAFPFLVIRKGGSVPKAPGLPCCHLVEKVLERPQNKDGNRHLEDVRNPRGHVTASWVTVLGLLPNGGVRSKD